MPALPNFRIGVVDVRDVVAAEISAMFTPFAVGKRFILCGGAVDFKDYAVIVKTEFEPQGYSVPSTTIPKFILWGMKFFNPAVKVAYPGVNKKHSWSNERMKNKLGVTPQSTERSILDTCYSMIELGLINKTPSYRGLPEKRNKTFVLEGEVVGQSS